jgi:hypothetical protein
VLEWLSFVRIELTEALDGNSATRVRRIIGQVEPIKLRYPRPSFLFVGSLATTDFLRPCSEEDLDDPMDFDGLSRDEEFAIRAERNRLHERGETGNRTRLLALLTPSIEAHNREEIVKEVGEYLAIRIGAAYYCYFDTQHFSAEYAERKQRIQKALRSLEKFEEECGMVSESFASWKISSESVDILRALGFRWDIDFLYEVLKSSPLVRSQRRRVRTGDERALSTDARRRLAVRIAELLRDAGQSASSTKDGLLARVLGNLGLKCPERYAEHAVKIVRSG